MHVLHVNSRRVGPVDDLDAAKERILAAYRSGGDFLVFGQWEVLVAPGVSVMFEHVSVDDETVAAGASGPEAALTNLDDFDEFGI